jgi:peroxiredoxin
VGDIDIVVGKPAPDFECQDSEGKKVRLSYYQGKSHVVLVFNRGFS